MKKIKKIICFTLSLILCIGQNIPVMAENQSNMDYFYVRGKWDYSDFLTDNRVSPEYGNAENGYWAVEKYISPSFDYDGVLTCYTGDGQTAELIKSNTPYSYEGNQFENSVVFKADEQHPWQEGAGFKLKLFSGMSAFFNVITIELGVRGNAPKSWKLQYSTDNEQTWVDYTTATINKENEIILLFNKINLPQPYDDEQFIYIFDNYYTEGIYDASKDPYSIRLVAVKDGTEWENSVEGEVCLKQVCLYFRTGQFDNNLEASPTPTPAETQISEETPATQRPEPANSVQQTPETSIKLNYRSLDIQKGKKTDAVKIIKAFPETTVFQKAKSSNRSIASAKIKNGKLIIRGKKKGVAVITVTAANKASAQLTVHIKKTVKAEKISFDTKKIIMKRGTRKTLRLNIFPVTAAEKIFWNTSDKKIVKVTQKGRIVARKKGTAVIKAKTASGVVTKCRIKVK